MSTPRGVLFDFSGTLFRLEENDGWFDGLAGDDGGAIEGAARAELMRRMTAPMGLPVPMTGDLLAAWHARDLDPALHRRVYHHVLEQSGLTDPVHREAFYSRVTDPDHWVVYPDTAAVFRALRAAGLRIGVLSNIAYDIRPAFEREGIADLVDSFTLSFEVGHAKPDPAVFEIAARGLGIEPGSLLMVGDSIEADGAATGLGCAFALVDPVPVADRPDGLWSAVRAAGVPV